MQLLARSRLPRKQAHEVLLATQDIHSAGAGPAVPFDPLSHSKLSKRGSRGQVSAKSVCLLGHHGEKVSHEQTISAKSRRDSCKLLTNSRAEVNQTLVALFDCLPRNTIVDCTPLSAPETRTYIAPNATFMQAAYGCDGRSQELL